MPKSKSTLSLEILETLYDLAQLLPRPFETPYAHLKRIRNIGHRQYYNAVYDLKRRGLIEESKKQKARWIKITAKGQLKILFDKAQHASSDKWDGKWRLIIFDIPESVRDQRHELRSLLRANNFYKLQASVFISPHPINREAVSYLRQTKLLEYIRILRIDEIDDDRVLRKHFKLTKWKS